MEEQTHADTAAPLQIYSPASASASVLGSQLGKHGRDPAQGDDVPQKLFRCGQCDKRYSRIDHLSRHSRLHTQERPYVCEQCGKTFGRADLLKRHAAGHSQQNVAKSRPRPNSTSNQARVNQACVACAELHLKCQSEKPCSRCSNRGLVCRYSSTSASDTEAVAHDLLSLLQPRINDTNVSGSETAAVIADENPGLVHPSGQMTTLFPPPVVDDDHHVRFADVDQSDALTAEFDQSHTMDAAFDDSMMYDHDTQGLVDGTDLRDYLQNIMGHENQGLPSSGLWSGNWTPRNLFDIRPDADLELNDIDLNFLNDYNENNPFVTIPDTASSTGSLSLDPPLGIESLQKSSTWRFRPLSKDNVENNLSLPPTEAGKKFVVHRRATPVPLSYDTRDQVLSMIVTLTPDTKTVLSFPSVDLLDSLLQYFLTSTATAASFIHAATFVPSQKRPELCTAMIAAGASSTPDPSLRKLGMVLMEATRLAIPYRMEKDNTLSRDLQLLQAAVLSLRIGLYSGNSRKTEFAEAFMQPFTTMVRRGGWLRRKHNSTVPLPEDEGDELENKWHRWIEEQSRARLVFALFQQDAEASISLFINPILSSGDLTLPLPQPSTLWLARSAVLWKQTFLSMSPVSSRIPSVPDLLHDIDRYVEPREAFDGDIATQALIFASWRMVHEYRQQMRLTHSVANQWHSGPLLLSSRRAELEKLLKCVHMRKPDPPSMLLLSNLLSMHLHMSLEDVHLFAGLEGQDEAKKVFPSLKESIATAGARQAMWHAGQVIRHAGSISGMRDFVAVAFYQAALAIWTFGVMVNTSPNTGVEGRDRDRDKARDKASNPVVLINEPEAPATDRFIALNRGRPAIALASTSMSATKTYALLEDPALVMTGLIDILSLTHPSIQARPPLIENLLELMGDLKAAVPRLR